MTPLGRFGTGNVLACHGSRRPSWCPQRGEDRRVVVAASPRPRGGEGPAAPRHRSSKAGRPSRVNIDHFIATSGYLTVFLLVAAESLGVPLPGETALVAAGIYAGHTHHLNIWIVFAVASVAAILGDNIGFWIGDKGGYRLARRYGKKVRLDERKLKVGRYIFDRHGVKVVFFGRFVSILRTYAAFLAGTSKMRWRRFLPANAAGGILWSAIYAFGSYLAGSAFRHLSTKLDLILGIVAVVVIVAVLFAVRHQTDKLVDKAELAYPGPLE